MARDREIDVVRAAISGDAQAVIKDQMARAQREIIERLGLNITTREAIHELLSSVRTTIMQLEPHNAWEADDPRARHERLALEHEYRQLILRLSEEQRSCWNDVQRLKSELRACERELLTQQQREQRLRDL
jgi:predicted NUDIX family NTP pyrophosphohydrolase